LHFPKIKKLQKEIKEFEKGKIKAVFTLFSFGGASRGHVNVGDKGGGDFEEMVSQLAMMWPRGHQISSFSFFLLFCICHFLHNKTFPS
jgi:hypothetical protein